MKQLKFNIPYHFLIPLKDIHLQVPTISFLVRFNTTSEWYWWHTSKYKKGYHLKCVLYWAICHFFSRPTPSYCSRLNCIGWTKARACQELFLFWICQTIMNWLFWKSAPFFKLKIICYAIWTMHCVISGYLNTYSV